MLTKNSNVKEKSLVDLFFRKFNNEYNIFYYKS